MHNDHDKLIRLRELANTVRNYQLERGLSDAKICTDIAHLGSTKTYKRILDETDDLDQLDLDKQLKNYEAAVETVVARRSKDKLAEPEYDDFENVISVRGALQRALEEDGLQRFVCVEGDTATGKDAALNTVVKKWPKITVAVNANPFWTNSFQVPTETLFQKLNIRRRDEEGPLPMPRYPSDRAAMIFEELKKRKLILAINEGHHCGVQMLDLIKTIINDTPSIVVLFCYPALLRKLISNSWDQANQLFGNRLCERVYLPTPPADEIGILLERRGVKFADAAARNDAIGELAKEAPGLGNWTYVKLVCRELAIASRTKPLDTPTFTKLRAIVRNRRIPRSMQQGGAR